MKVTRDELNHLIEEEINEIFGFGKKEPSKEYPASELATIIRGLHDASKMLGAELTSSQREAIVDELTGVLEDEGFVIKEDERLFTGEEDVIVTHQNAPKLKEFLDTVAQKNPKVFKQLLGLFNRSALDISPVVKDITDKIPSILTVADPEPDEDQTDTIVMEPVAAPDPEDEAEDIPSILTVADPEDPPEEEIEELQVGDLIDGTELFHSRASKKHLLHNIFKPGTYRVVARDLDEENPIEVVHVDTQRYIANLLDAAFLDYPEFFTVSPGAERRLTEHKQLKRMKVLAGVK